jgi:predicted nuclease of predicted toxin-antitoxin system
LLLHLDVVEARKAGLLGIPDPELLEWAASQDRILVTRDMPTMPDFAHARVVAGLPMPGVFILRRGASIGAAIESLLLVPASRAEEWVNRVIYLPFD